MLYRILRICAGLVILGGVSLSLTYVHFEYGNRLWPANVGELRGIEIGDSRADVLFKKGAPTLESNTADRHLYISEGRFEMLTVQYTRDEVVWVSVGNLTDRHWGAAVAGVRLGDFESRVTEKLGEPDSTSDKVTENGGVERSYHYFKLGVEFNLARERVVSIVVK